MDNLETLLEQGRVYNDRSGNQEWTIQSRYQSRVEFKMTEVAMKNGQSRDVTRVGQNVQ